MINRYIVFLLVGGSRGSLDCDTHLEDLLLLGLLGQEHSLDVGQNTTLSDGDAGEELVQLFVVPDGQLQVTGDDPRLLVVTSGITSQLENFSSEVLHHGSEVHGGTGTDAIGIVALAEKPVDTANGELETSSRRARLRLAFNFTALAASRHDDAI